MAIVTVTGVPHWVDVHQLLDDQPWDRGANDTWMAERTVREAADLQARLRNLGMDGRPIQVDVQPKPRRTIVREARSNEARRLRNGDAGFAKKGTQLDEEGRYSLTSERLALALADEANVRTVVDATAGCGGNAIAFARRGANVIAIEKDRNRLEMARHNANVYGVEDRITFLNGDARSFVPVHDADLLFIDPPWGEVDRIWCQNVPLLNELLASSTSYSRVWAKVPPSFAPCPLHFRPEAWFGRGEGDARRVKFVLLRRDAPV